MTKKIYGIIGGHPEKYEIPEDVIFIITTFAFHEYNPKWWMELLLKLHWRKSPGKWYYKIITRLQEMFLWDRTLYTILIRGILENYYNIRHRSIGYYNEFKDAEEAVLNNYGDMYETEYEFVLVEATKEGLYPTTYETQWYKWIGDSRTGKYIRFDGPNKVPYLFKHKGIPKHFEGLCGFGLG
jgi:hypothetical protein